MAVGQLAIERRQQLQQILAVRFNPEQMAQLTAGNQQGRTADKAGNHRVAEKVGEEPQTQDRQQQQNAANQQG